MGIEITISYQSVYKEDGALTGVTSEIALHPAFDATQESSAAQRCRPKHSITQRPLHPQRDTHDFRRIDSAKPVFIKGRGRPGAE